jgi:hypothetical protein
MHDLWVGSLHVAPQQDPAVEAGKSKKTQQPSALRGSSSGADLEIFVSTLEVLDTRRSKNGPIVAHC